MSSPALAAAAPVSDVDADATGPEDGIGIALSGGGYRAMLFHVGTLWRLHQLGLLARASRISSVSGGSITAGVLARNWGALVPGDDDSFREQVARPILRLAGKTLDIPTILFGLPLHNAGWFVARCYRRHLFGKTTLQDLPDTPRFVFNATELHTGTLWRFSKPYMGSWKLGRAELPRVPLATAVAASSGFPPFLSPIRLRFRPSPQFPGDGTLKLPWRMRLTDGGVYDNLGMETVWKRYRTLFVSDGGASLAEVKRPCPLWVPQTLRVLSIMQNQVGALRVRQLIGSLLAGSGPLARNGAYSGIATDPATANLAPNLPCDRDRARELAATKTALRALPEEYRQRLVNWGYALADARIRQFHDPALPMPPGFPYPQAGV